jgi:hypothetical protein
MDVYSIIECVLRAMAATNSDQRVVCRAVLSLLRFYFDFDADLFAIVDNRLASEDLSSFRRALVYCFPSRLTHSLCARPVLRH